MNRVHAVDIGRTLALIGMVIFHTGRDLEIFGALPPGTTLSGFWYYLARIVAGSFFFFAGVSIVLAHGREIYWRAFWRRTMVIAAAALLVSSATYIAFPTRFVYFGILHSIAVCSLIGLAFLRIPSIVTSIVVCGIIGLHIADINPLSSSVWSPTGLSQNVRPALDLLPIIPWLAALLLGVAVANIWRPVPTKSTRMAWILGWPGRHSLSIYLVHQPILLGAIWLAMGLV